MGVITKAFKWLANAITELLLWCFAILGIISVASLGAALLFDIRPVLISTGSMEPTLPVNSAVIVQEVPASEVEVGDIANLQTESMSMPVIHRVIDTEPAEGSDATLIQMQGDANDQPDSTVYEVETAEIYLAHVPGVAQAIDRVSSPMGITVLAIMAPALFFVVFWPWGEGKRHEEKEAVVSKELASLPAGQHSYVVGPNYVAAVTADGVEMPPAPPKGTEMVLRDKPGKLVSVRPSLEAQIRMLIVHQVRSSSWVELPAPPKDSSQRRMLSTSV